MPEGQRQQEPGHQPAAAAARCCYRAPYGTEWERARPRHGDGDDRRPGGRRPRRDLAGHGRQGPAAATARSASPASAARRWTTRRTTSSRSCSPRWARSRSRTRRVFDTPPRFPVWGPRSAAAARPTFQQDLANADCIVIQGSNMAEAHPVGLPVGDGGQGARRDGHPRRPAVHPHQRGGRPLRADPGRLATSRSSAAIVNHILEQRAGLPRVRRWPTPTPPRSSATTSRTPRTSTGCSPASTRRPGPTTRRPGSTRARSGDGTGRQRRVATASGRPPPAMQHESHGAGRPRRSRARRDAAAPALRLPDPQAALRPLHAGDGGAGLRRLAASSSREVCEAWTANSRPGAHHRARLLGRLDPAHRRRAVHPHRRDHPAAAGQHRPARRRHHGAARARQHPGLDRHPDAVQPAARLPADAAPRRSTRRSATGSTRCGTRARRASGPTPRAYAVSLLKAYFGRRGDRRQRLLLRLPAPAHRRPRHLPARCST